MKINCNFRVKTRFRHQREDIRTHSSASEYSKPIPRVTNNMIIKTTACYLEDVKTPIFDIITIPPPNVIASDDVNYLYELDNVPDPPKLLIPRKSELSGEELMVDNIGTLDLSESRSPEQGEREEIKSEKDETQSCYSTLDRPLKSALKKPGRIADIVMEESSQAPQINFPHTTFLDKAFPPVNDISRLPVDTLKLAESLKMLEKNTPFQSQSSSIERPRSVGSAYHMLPLYPNYK